MDPRLCRKKRMKAAKGPLKNRFEAALLEFSANFKKTAGFKHAQTKGNEREVQVRTLFEDILPACYSAVTGELVDIYGNRSRQLDVIVFNSHKNAAFISGESKILPAEAALVTVEVKSKLTVAEIITCYQAAKRLKKLRPLGRPISKLRKKGKPAGKKFRFFHCVFSYDTDLSQDKWPEREYNRLVKTIKSNNYSLDLIDRIYVVDRGVIMPQKGVGLTEEKQTGNALMHFFLHAMNFCLREDGRRPHVDYVNYAHTTGKGWYSLKS